MVTFQGVVVINPATRNPEFIVCPSEANMQSTEPVFIIFPSIDGYPGLTTRRKHVCDRRLVDITWTPWYSPLRPAGACAIHAREQVS
jgi:hypothetical protein